MIIHQRRILIFAAALFLLTACRRAPQPVGAGRFRAEVWVDNWFALYAGEKLIGEDSVPITTERSFNAEVFAFDADYPLTLNFVLKDFKENDTGLEYIGKPNQQIGDGGVIAQFTDSVTGASIAVTNEDWRCLVIHDAPLGPGCAEESAPVAGQAPCTFESRDEPMGWRAASFDDSAWPHAVIYSAAEVSPKEGYGQISWHPTAKFIWGSNLKTNNTVLCRLTVTAEE